MLKLKAMELKEEINNLKTLCMEEIVNNGVDDVDERGFKALKSTLKLINLSNEFLVEEAKMMDDMNKKLDKLLEKIEEMDRDA